MFNKVWPLSLPTSTAPGLNPKVLFFPGPINNVSVFPLVTLVWNSVPLDPSVPSGTSTVKLSGFFLLINPEITFKLPCFTLATIFPSLVSGSYIKVSITTSDSAPIVKVDWSKSNICVPEFSAAKIVSFKYILSPALRVLLPVLTVPFIAPTIPTNCFSIVSFSSACKDVVKNTKPTIKDNILFIRRIYTNFLGLKNHFFTHFGFLQPEKHNKIGDYLNLLKKDFPKALNWKILKYQKQKILSRNQNW